MRAHSSGVTLIELMVAIAVLGVLAALAIPSFSDFRQRRALEGAADQLVAAWGDARFEALRRNSMVKVGLKTTSAGLFCVGVATTTATDDDTACDCLQPVSTDAGRCNVSIYPSDQESWRGVAFAGKPTLGDDDNSDNGVAVIDHKRGGLTQSTDVGGIALKSPSGARDYRLTFVVDRNGRAYVCEPTVSGATKLPNYSSRQC